ncbi:MAG: hypothetical protein IKC69_01685 [Clostridia bacterium]|nr:hypothetical protein [Clostridia bacterium]
MLVWWNSLSLLAQIFLLVAIPSTLILVIQTVLMLIGLGSEGADADVDADVDVDVEGDGDGIFSEELPEADPDPTGLDALRVFTVRGIIAFLVVFGWIGYGMEQARLPLWLSFSSAFLGGSLMMLLLAFLMRGVMRLRGAGNLDNRNALGVSGKVYLTVPAARSGVGKINLMLQGSFVERDAVTDESTDLVTGQEVLVTGLSGQATLVVKRK